MGDEDGYIISSLAGIILGKIVLFNVKLGEDLTVKH